MDAPRLKASLDRKPDTAPFSIRHSRPISFLSAVVPARTSDHGPGRGPALGLTGDWGARPRRPAFSNGPPDQFVRDTGVPIAIESRRHPWVDWDIHRWGQAYEIATRSSDVSCVQTQDGLGADLCWRARFGGADLRVLHVRADGEDRFRRGSDEVGCRRLARRRASAAALTPPAGWLASAAATTRPRRSPSVSLHLRAAPRPHASAAIP
jgi:hypothetical protein